MNSQHRNILRKLLIALLGISGCAPQHAILPEFYSIYPSRLVLVPVTPSSTADQIEIEAQRLLEQATVDELRRKGYLVVDPSMVHEVCAPTSNLPPKENTCIDYFLSAPFSTYFPIDGVVMATLNHHTRNSFVIGFYNSAAASIVIESVGGSRLYQSSHSARDNGGPLLQAGQVLTGVQEQYQQFSQPDIVSSDPLPSSSNLSQLLYSLTSELLAPLPTAAIPLSGDSAEAGIKISALTVDQVKNLRGHWKVCAHAPPLLQLSLLVGTARSRLREISPGRYCSVLPISSTARSYQLIARSPFGRLSVVDQVLPEQRSCLRPRNFLSTLQITWNPNALSIGLRPSDHTASLAEARNDDNVVKKCSVKELLLIGAPSGAGPFRQLARGDHAISVKDPQLTTTLFLLATFEDGDSEVVRLERPSDVDEEKL